jgi:phenylalanyl-tRNA synthetase alpha chain
MDDIIASLHPYERRVLPLLKDYSTLKDLVSHSGLQHVEVMRALQWLSNKKVLTIKDDKKELIDLDSNGKKYLVEGLPERRLLRELKNGKLKLSKIKTVTKDELNICIGTLKKKNAIKTEKRDELIISLNDHGKTLLQKDFLEETFLKKQFPMNKEYLQAEEKFAFDNLIKRKQIIKTELIKEKSATLTELGKKLIEKGIGSKDYIEKLTPNMVKTCSWKGKEFRKYDIKINVPKISYGKKHFMNEVIDYIKKIWLELGFKEMEGGMVQTAFWDMDSLFVPQDHPVREMQDTFYVKGKGTILNKDYYNKVRKTHENGWTTGSKGWQARFSEEKARQLLLRTHTTVLSAQSIKRLKLSDLPQKYFSVSKCYRNEVVDWKHLFEFYQVEGIVVDPNANMKHLLGYLKEFYGKMGYEKIRIRPAYFPYTEPSAEVEGFHPVKKEWVELGGAGIFRPEVVKPLLGKDIPVLAWGLGMERIISAYYKITDIRDLYKNDLKQLRDAKKYIEVRG